MVITFLLLSDCTNEKRGLLRNSNFLNNPKTQLFSKLCRLIIYVYNSQI